MRIMAAEEVGQDFHSRWLAQGKTYRYRIYRGRVLPPFDYRRALHYPWPLDESAMAAAARYSRANMISLLSLRPPAPKRTTKTAT